MCNTVNIRRCCYGRDICNDRSVYSIFLSEGAEEVGDYAARDKQQNGITPAGEGVIPFFCLL